MKTKCSFGIRDKLISIFILIKVLPLIALAWFAWSEISFLVEKMQLHFQTASEESQSVGEQIVNLATENSIQALDEKSRETIERLTTDTALDVARFLHERDRDIQMAAQLKPSKTDYQRFLSTKFQSVIEHDHMVMDSTGSQWESATASTTKSSIVEVRNQDNKKNFHSRPPDILGHSVNRPLYLEITFIDLTGHEKIKITTSDILQPELRDVSIQQNTFCKAESFFHHLKALAPGEIYVSDVIGAYQRTHMIGPYTSKRAKEKGIVFAPEESGYAGQENPVGKRFQGLIRWATPVEQNGKTIGYVTLALDHTHLMEFTDHIVPTEKRYTTISDAGSGNYAFMWDYRNRNISHPRDYFIVGYDPETGQIAPPWLEKKHYEQLQSSGQSTNDFLSSLPLFDQQDLSKKPAPEQTKSGFVALDCRYLNFAPQCEGWNNLTQHGGSGSFLIYWSGLWKLTTAASIPYFTGQYGTNARGFGYITIGANVHEFHKAAINTAKDIASIGKDHLTNLNNQYHRNEQFLLDTLRQTTRDLSLSTMAMIILVIIIAIWMASSLTGRITQIIGTLKRFQGGDMDERLQIHSRDELEDLATSFNTMADTIQKSIIEIQVAHQGSEKANQQLLEEIKVREAAEAALAQHRDTLEQTVFDRTRELELEITERKQTEKSNLELETRLHQAEKMEAIGTLAGGVAHDLNNILSGILTYPDLLLLQVGKDSSMYKPLQTIKSSGEKAAAIVQDLLTLARRGVAVTDLLNLNTIINSYLDSPEHQHLLRGHPNVHIELHLAHDLMPLLGSEVHLFQTVMNLISNGVESMTIGGHLTIKTENRYLDKPLKLYDEVVEGDYVTLIISDTGHGIREDDIDRIYEPFYTKKKMGRSGTGLGMAVVWGTVQDHKGYIDCQSKINRGTVFTIYFPVCRDLNVMKPTSPKLSQLKGNGERILVVDDLKDQLEIASMILKELDYTVHAVSSGEEALAYLEENEADLVILDMIMEPGMDGLDTYQAILTKHPNQKAIIASGYSETDRLSEALRLGVGSYIKKPYSVSNLGQSVLTGLNDGL